MNYNLKDYEMSVRQFVEDSQEWGGLEEYKFYTSDYNGWTETSDNAHGGLDVSWAFQLNPTFEEIRDKFIELLKNELDSFNQNDVKNFEISLENLD